MFWVLYTKNRKEIETMLEIFDKTGRVHHSVLYFRLRGARFGDLLNSKGEVLVQGTFIDLEAHRRVGTKIIKLT